VASSEERIFFDDLARNMGFDPLIPQNWYGITSQDLINRKGARAILDKHGNSHIKAILHVLSHLDLEEHKFGKMPRHFWKDNNNFRIFFEELAEERGFNSNVAENWYNLPQKFVQMKKGGSSVLNHFNGSHIRALIYALPELKLDAHKFQRPVKVWKGAENHRKFFDEFAKEFKFDPLIVENWFRFPAHDVLQRKGGQSVLKEYDNSLKQALMTSYSQLDFSGFQEIEPMKSAEFWSDIENHKKFFEVVASDVGFDPLIPENWYSITRHDVADKKGLMKLILHYNAALDHALPKLFPALNLEKQRLRQLCA